MARGDGPYKVAQNVGDNAYKIELSGDMKRSTAFNVGDLTPCLEDDEEHNEALRTNPLQGGGVDGKQLLSLDLLSLVRVMNQVVAILTLGQGLGSPRLILTWSP